MTDILNYETEEEDLKNRYTKKSKDKEHKEEELKEVKHSENK